MGAVTKIKSGRGPAEHADFNRANSLQGQSSSYGDSIGIEVMPEQNGIACRLT